jgi:uridine kinase
MAFAPSPPWEVAVQRKNPIIIGVAGGTGSGKTTVAREILSRVGENRIAYIEHDSYYRDLSHLPPAERARVNFDHPDSLETDLLIRHLQGLLRGEPAHVPSYDFTVHARTAQTRTVQPRPVILIEGILIFADRALRELMDVRIFVDTDADLRLIRRLTRDIHERGRTLDSVIHQYMETVRPMHLEFVEPSKRYANVIIPEGGFNLVALEMVVARIRSLLDESEA